jgi:putative SbcD/Mre11-related phosphoesterase
MKLTEDIELLEGMPIAFIKSLNSIVASDFHLGYEGAMVKNGMFVPKVNLKRIIENLDKAISKTGADRLIIVGDIKHDFSNIESDEFNELYDLMNFLKRRKVSAVLIKGNHDNFVERYREPFKLLVHGQEAAIGDYLFFHGEELPKVPKKKPRMLIMGQEHPAISINRSVGKREKLRCFLYGRYEKLPILVLPAMGYFSTGTDVNHEPKDQLLSPVFKRTDIDRMHAIAIGYGSTIDFGEVSKLRGI